MSDCVLVLNSGSSSLKFAIYVRSSDGRWSEQARGQIDAIGADSRLRARDVSGRSYDEPLAAGSDHRGALGELMSRLDGRLGVGRIVGIGHRVVHGGTRYSAPALVTDQVLEDLRALVPLAPLHQPHNIAPIELLRDQHPGIPQVVCFDTSFHQGWAAVAELVPLPRRVRDAGVQRYGFHGLSYEYIASMLPSAAPEIAEGRVIVAHLGNGASLCALRARKSVDCTFGFTALDGLCMGTRPGALDPGVVLYLFESLGLSAREVQTMLYEQSGLLGVSEVSSDMRTLLASGAPAARLAVDYFVYRAAKEIGACAAVLGGLDALVFTAGIGENSAEIRRRICAASAWLGIELDATANERRGPRLSVTASRVSAWVLPTNEELMIAQHAGTVLKLGEPA